MYVCMCVCEAPDSASTLWCNVMYGNRSPKSWCRIRRLKCHVCGIRKVFCLVPMEYFINVDWCLLLCMNEVCFHVVVWSVCNKLFFIPLSHSIRNFREIFHVCMLSNPTGVRGDTIQHTYIVRGRHLLPDITYSYTLVHTWRDNILVSQTCTRTIDNRRYDPPLVTVPAWRWWYNCTILFCCLWVIYVR